MTDWRDAYPVGTKVEVMTVNGPPGWQPGVVSSKTAGTERPLLWVDLGDQYGACFADADKVRPAEVAALHAVQNLDRGPGTTVGEWLLQRVHAAVPYTTEPDSEALRTLRYDYGERAVVLAESHAVVVVELARRQEDTETQKLIERLRDALSDALTAYGNKWTVPESVTDLWEVAEDDATEWLAKRTR